MTSPNTSDETLETLNGVKILRHGLNVDHKRGLVWRLVAYSSFILSVFLRCDWCLYLLRYFQWLIVTSFGNFVETKAKGGLFLKTFLRRTYIFYACPSINDACPYVLSQVEFSVFQIFGRY